MGTVKFKKYTSKTKSIVATALLTFIITIVLTLKISYVVSEKVIYTADAMIDTENKTILKNAFFARDFSEIDIDNLITVVKNSNGEIIQVDFKVFECERLMLQIVRNISQDTKMLADNGYILYVPLGYITNTPLRTNLGPKIPVNIALSDVVIGTLRTEVKTVGINNSLLELYIDLDFTVNTVLPFVRDTVTTHYSALVVSTLVSGKVPSFYSGILKDESATFNLPISENL